MTEPSVPESIPTVDGSIFGPHKLTQFLVLFAVGLSCLLFWLAAYAVGIPIEPGFRGSLLQPPASIVALIAGAALLLACSVIGNWIAGNRWPLAGLLAATIGLAVWAVRGGTMQYVLMHASDTGMGSGIFLRLLLELLLFFAVIAGIWNALWRHESRRRVLTASRPPHPTIVQKDEGRSTGAALLAQCGVTALLVFLVLAETGVKKQVMVGLFLAGVAGTSIAEMFFATRETWRWYWIAPLVTGIVGYIAGYMQPAGIEVGYLTGMLAPLSRALPLDYASLGVAGALAGHWLSAPEIIEDAEDGEPVSVTPRS
jgi:hypothetical protein